MASESGGGTPTGVIPKTQTDTTSSLNPGPGKPNGTSSRTGGSSTISPTHYQDFMAQYHEKMDQDYNLPIGNAYEELTDNEDYIEVSNIKRRKRTNAHIQRNPQKVTVTKMPPIRIYNTDIRQLCNSLTNTLKHKNFKIDYCNRNMSFLVTNTVADHKAAITVCNELKTKYYSNTPRELKTVNFVLKNLALSYDADDVTQALNEIKFSESTKFIKATKFSPAPSKSNMFLIQFSPSSKAQEIVKIERLHNQSVIWSLLKKSEMTQCYRCQRFGHASTYCGMEERCVKCLDSHEKGKCKISPKTTENATHDPMEDNEENPAADGLLSKSKPACVNCRSTGHPASWRGCPTYKLLIQRRDDRIAMLKEKQVDFNRHRNEMMQNFTRPGYSYASNFHPNNADQQFPPLPRSGDNKFKRNVYPKTQSSTYTSNPMPNLQHSSEFEPEVIIGHGSEENALSYLQGECNELFGCDLFALMRKIKDFLPKHKQITNKDEKQYSLLSFLTSVVDYP